MDKSVSTTRPTQTQIERMAKEALTKKGRDIADYEDIKMLENGAIAGYERGTGVNQNGEPRRKFRFITSACVDRQYLATIAQKSRKRKTRRKEPSDVRRRDLLTIVGTDRGQNKRLLFADIQSKMEELQRLMDMEP